jgi:quinolinate synthase
MFRIDPWHLAWALENLVEGELVNVVEVDPETRHWATVALERMLALS